MAYKVSVSFKGELLFKIQIPRSGITIGSGPEAEITLPVNEQEKPFALLQPMQNAIGITVKSGPGFESEGKYDTKGIIRAGQRIKWCQYGFQVEQVGEVEHRISSQQATATIKFNPKTDIVQTTSGKLEVTKGIDKGLCLKLEQDRIVLGSDPACDLIIKDEYVSGRHCELVLNHSKCILRDLDSTNGTFIGDNSVKDVILNPGDTFKIGKTTISLNLTTNSMPIKPSKQSEYCGMIGKSKVMRKIFSLIDKVAPTRVPVLIEGPTGTGKELAARAIHRKSTRASAPFIPVNCGAISPELVESELFGHVKGAFTGADYDSKGLFELADQGTLFLDEISELPPSLQPKLLRVLEDAMIRRVGGEQLIKTDVRILAATNTDLQTMIDNGKFRKDLYYRLALIKLTLPALNERKDDLPAIADHFINTESKALGILPPPSLGASAVARLKSHGWPGNIRELKNVISRALIVAGNQGEITAGDVDFGPEEKAGYQPETLAQAEKTAIKKALKITRTKKEAAGMLNIALSTLYDKMKKHRLD